MIKHCSAKILNLFENSRNCYYNTPTSVITTTTACSVLDSLYVLLGVPQKGELEGNLMAVSVVESSIQEWGTLEEQ